MWVYIAGRPENADSKHWEDPMANICAYVCIKNYKKQKQRYTDTGRLRPNKNLEMSISEHEVKSSATKALDPHSRLKRWLFRRPDTRRPIDWNAYKIFIMCVSCVHFVSRSPTRKTGAIYHAPTYVCMWVLCIALETHFIHPFSWLFFLVWLACQRREKADAISQKQQKHLRK